MNKDPRATMTIVVPMPVTPLIKNASKETIEIKIYSTEFALEVKLTSTGI